ncbi:tripartite tricarboxylate transporter permease [Halostella pelagica]|uniref:tripartite tricarboxylate transporter permease n=1 Tax=Halostella pelagica TaxID=2583824 RepID=UPI0010803AB7|nr:tripartite tricarboxylate transporter permease [Halostella pelagica]
MEEFGIRVFTAPERTVAVLAFVLGGVALGTVSGLTPGLHANNFALVLAAAASEIPGPPLLLGVAMLAAGVVHTFLDAVPALALGVPDAAMAATALPGHRLVIAGRGREAVRLSALGSGLAVAVALPMAIPVTEAMTAVYPTLRAHMPLVLGAVVVLLVATERTARGAAVGLTSFAAAAALGWATLDLSPAAPLAAGGMLTPLFAGLFGAPVLIDALGGAGVPEQADAAVTSTRRAVFAMAAAGALAGAVVGYLPGISSAIAAVAVLTLTPGSAGDRGYVVATSGVNTANTLFALFALVAIRQPRTGVLVAFDEVAAPLNLPLLVGTAILASAAGFCLVLTVGDRYLRVVGRTDYRRLSMGILTLLVGLSWLFAGFTGVAVFVVSAALGLVPVRLGARRVHLMGVLIGPLALGV